MDSPDVSTQHAVDGRLHLIAQHSDSKSWQGPHRIRTFRLDGRLLPVLRICFAAIFSKVIQERPTVPTRDYSRYFGGWGPCRDPIRRYSIEMECHPPVFGVR